MQRIPKVKDEVFVINNKEVTESKISSAKEKEGRYIIHSEDGNETVLGTSSFLYKGDAENALKSRMNCFLKGKADI